MVQKVKKMLQMGRGTPEHIMGLSDHTVKGNKQNALFFGFRFWSYNPVGCWFSHNPNRSVWWRPQCRGLRLQSRPRWRTQGECTYSNGWLSKAVSKNIQPEGPTQTIFSGSPRSEKSYWKHQGAGGQENRPELGRTLQYSQARRQERLLPWRLWG